MNISVYNDILQSIGGVGWHGASIKGENNLRVI